MNKFLIVSGERVDIELKTNQPPGKYLMNVIGLQDCRGLQQEVYIVYNNDKKNSTVIKDQLAFTDDNLFLIEKGYNCQKVSENIMCTLDLHGPTNYQLKDQVDTTVYIPFDMNSFSLTDTMTDNRYNMYGTAFYPAYLSTSQKARVAQINGMSFKYPSSPLLSQPEKTSEDAVCSHEKRASQCNDTPLFCECIQIIEVPYNSTVEFVLIDEGFGGNSSHTFHVHGYNASVVGSKSFDRPISKKEVMLLDNDRILHRNLINPPFKDTFVVPNKGYTILRFKTDNLGYWLWEARGTGASPKLLGPGMKFLMKVGPNETLPPTPLNFPTCSSNKNPDQIFEEN